MSSVRRPRNVNTCKIQTRQMTTSPRSNPQKSPSFQNFFPRSHFRPCRGIRNWLSVHDLTFVNLIFLKKAVLPLVLQSDTRENTYFGQAAKVSPGWKIWVSRPLWGGAIQKVVSLTLESDQFDPWKWSVWPLKVVSLTPESGQFEAKIGFENSKISFKNLKTGFEMDEK